VGSITEGMCTPLVEAMAAAKAAVATGVGGVPEVVVDGTTGFLVPPRDRDAMAERLIRLLKDDTLRRRMGEAGRERARERFTVDRMVAATAVVYRSLAAGSARHAAAG
jgi:glycosyltransferase involved in cell wall biosynthesis